MRAGTTQIRRPCPAKRHVPDEDVSIHPGQRNWVWRFDNGYTVDLCRSKMTRGLEAALIFGGEFVKGSSHTDWFDQYGMCRLFPDEVDNLLDDVKALP